MRETRRFSPPWSVEDNSACFIVKDSSGQKLGYFYYEEESGRRSTAKMLSKDGARRIAANFAKLPELLPSPNSIYQLSGVHLTGAFGPSHCMYAPPGAFILMT